MGYKEKIQIKLFSTSLVYEAIIDDYQDCSFTMNEYSAGEFFITINYNIPNAQKFKRGMFVQFENNPYYFGEIQEVSDSIGSDGKASQIRRITGYDARYIFQKRIIKNLNSVDSWSMTAKGEICMRNLIQDQCGTNAEEKRRLPITNIIPQESDAVGNVCSVSESYTNLYEVLEAIATQSETGWRVAYRGGMVLEFFEAKDRSNLVNFSTDMESLFTGNLSDSTKSYTNAIYIGGKGEGAERDIYEGEIDMDGSPSGLARYESWDDESSMTTESEYESKAKSMLAQYGQTISISGQGLIECPYVYGKDYNVGDIVTITVSETPVVCQITEITESWGKGRYNLDFEFGKPIPSLGNQFQTILKLISKASNKQSTTDSIRWYTIPVDTEMPSCDVTYRTIGFIGSVGTNATFKLYLDDQRNGAKTYHVYFKQLGGTGKLTLTTGVSGAVDLVMNPGTYVAIITVKENGDIQMASSTPTNTIQSGNNQPVTSDAVLVGSQTGSIINEWDTTYWEGDSVEDIVIPSDGYYYIYVLLAQDYNKSSNEFKLLDSDRNLVVYHQFNSSGTIVFTHILPLKAGNYRYAHESLGGNTGGRCYVYMYKRS